MNQIAGRKAKLGRSGMLASIFLLLGVGVVLAAVYAVMRVGLQGNIKQINPPSMTAVSTNDDGVVDFAQFDPNDDGLDPSGIVIPGGAPRFAYDMQDCTATINGDGNVDVLMVDTYHTAYCSLRISVINDTAEALYLVEAVFTGSAPLETALNAASSCGYVLNPLETGNIIIDVWPVEGAEGSWTNLDNEIEVHWGLQNTFTCP